MMVHNMHYIIGLGNPGAKYEGTRHNVGFAAVRHFVASVGLPDLVASRAHSGEFSEGVLAQTEVAVLLPDTYMNNSGVAVAKLVPKDASRQLVVLYDDVDLPVGEYKLSIGRGDGGHNGIKSIVHSLGTKEFVRVRIGIAPKSFWTGKVRRPAAAALSRHVLGRFTTREEKQLAPVYDELVEVINTILEEGVERAMNTYNSKES